MKTTVFKIAICVAVFANFGTSKAQLVTKDRDGMYRNRSGGTSSTRAGAQMDQTVKDNLSMNNYMTQVYMASLRRLEQQTRAGRAIIRAKKATTRFVRPTPFSMAEWVKRCGATNSENTRVITAELIEQKRLWTEEGVKRGVNQNDMAQVLALANALAWESYSGGKEVTPRQFSAITAQFRRYLLKNEEYQGHTNADKKYLAEANMVNSTAGFYWLRSYAKSGKTSEKMDARRMGIRVLAESFGRGKAEDFTLTNEGLSPRGS